jgi:hypothetical protein
VNEAQSWSAEGAQVAMQVFELEKRLLALEALQSAVLGNGTLMRVADPGRAGMQPGGGMHVGRGGDGKGQMEPAALVWLRGACQLDSSDPPTPLTPVGIGERVEVDWVTDVYWADECIKKTFYQVVLIDGKVKEFRGPCNGLVICAKPCVELIDPECET